MKTHLIPSNRLRLAALLAVALILAGGLFLTTPQGQTWAQSVLRFFTRQENDVYPTQAITSMPTSSLPLVDQTGQTPTPAATPTPAGFESSKIAKRR